MYENEYLETQIMTAPGPRLHLMVIEAALRSARQGKLALEEKNFEASHQSLNHARECVTELIAGLNPEQSPEMVGSLKQLFAFIYRGLAMADIEHTPESIDQAIELLESHRQTWLELLEQLPQQQLQSQSPTTEWEG